MAFGVRSPGPRAYLARRGAQPAHFSPEVWSRDEFGYRLRDVSRFVSYLFVQQPPFHNSFQRVTGIRVFEEIA